MHLSQNGLYSNSKTIGGRAKWAEIWQSVIVVIYISTFDLLFLISFGGHSVQLSQNGLELISGIR